MEDLRYPIGPFQAPAGPLRAEEREAFIAEIADLPRRVREAVGGLSEAQLDTPYRPGGWTVRQVVHHVPESHMNSYVRVKLALTEEQPTVRPYLEDRWAERPEDKTAPVEGSLALLDALHARYVLVWRSVGPDEWSRAFRHPESGLNTLDRTLALYAWHGRHHLSQVTSLRARQGW